MNVARPFATIVVLLLSAPLSAAESPSAAQSPVINFQLPKDSKVSIALYDQQGNIVRQLLLAEPRKAGQNQAVWDGLDESNKPVPAGNYTWKMLASDGLKSKWLAMIGSGLNPGYQVMPGNGVGTMTAALAENGDVFVIAGLGEAVFPMARVTREGKAVWYSDHLMEGVNDCGSGVVDDKLFCLLNNGKLMCLDAKNGKGQWKKDQGWVSPGSWWKAEQSKYWLSARGSDIVLCNQDRGIVRWVSPNDGTTLEEVQIPTPRCVATDGKGQVFAITGDKIVRVTRQDKSAKDLVTGLTDPARLDVDPVSGEILVAERGASQQIKRFSPEGKLLATYGRAGGREFGPYKPEDFKHVTDITADGKGGFVVVEGTGPPVRTAFFDRQGTLTNEWYGGLAYSNQVFFDPANVASVWYMCESHLVNAKIDYEKGTSQIHGICKIRGLADGMTRAVSGGWRLGRRGDQLFLWGANQYPGILLIDEKNYTGKLVAAGDIHVKHSFDDDDYTPQIVREAVFDGNIPKEKPDDKIPGGRQMYIWSDANEDGMPQTNEINFSPFLRKAGYGGQCWVDQDMNIYSVDEYPQVLRPKGWTKSGAPLYGSWADMKNIAEMPPQVAGRTLSGIFGSAFAVMPGGEGYMGYFNDTRNPFGKGMFSDGIGGNYIVRWNKDGKVLWKTGRHSPDFGMAPGEARMIGQIAGFAHGCMMLTEWLCYNEVKNAVYVWDKEGLWVGRLLDDPDLTAAPKEAYDLCTENYGGEVIEVTEQNKAPGLKVGEVLFSGSGQNHTNIYRITGWDSFARQSGSIEVTPKQIELAKVAAVTAAVKRSTAKAKVKPYTATTLHKLKTPPVIDGMLDDETWKSASVADDFRVALTCEAPAPEATKVLLGYDDKNLYVAVRCDEPKMDSLKAFGKQQGDPLHIEDGVEIFIDRTCDRAHYLQIIVNTNGVYYTGIGWTMVAAQATVKAHHEKDAWMVELAVPWSELVKAYGQAAKDVKITDEAPKPGEMLGFNVVRNRYAGGEPNGSSWSPLLGNFNHSPHLFGTLYVGEELPSLAKTLAGGGAVFWKLGDRKVALDGKLDEWNGIKPLQIMDGSKLVSQLYLGWRDDGLYAAFDVKTDRPWKNSSSYEMAFNGGAAVDINLGPIDAKTKMAPGTARFLAAPQGDKTQLIEFLAQLLPGMPADKKAQRNYHTPAQGDADFARVAVVDGSAAAFAPPDGKGYVVEMKIPTYATRLQSGQQVKFDATVILADGNGTLSELRIPLFSTSADDMFVRSDVVVETTLRPANWGIGELE